MPTFMAECYWPGVRAETLVELGERVRSAILELNRRGNHVRLGRVWLTPSDEVAYLVLDGETELVREVCDRAAIPYDRITEMVEIELPGSPSS